MIIANYIWDTVEIALEHLNLHGNYLVSPNYA